MRWSIALVLVLAACSRAAVPDCPETPVDARPGDPTYGQTWVGMGNLVAELQERKPAAGQAFFDRDGAYVVDDVNHWQWDHAARTGYWPSLAAFEQAVAEDDPALDELDAALYDPEAWEATPIDEQQRPGQAMQAFAELARNRGLDVIITPGLTLPAAGDDCRTQDGESPEAAFLRCDIASLAAAHADVVEIQAQTLQSRPTAYRDFLEAATAQAHDANPDVVVLSGLRTHNAFSVDDAEDAWAASMSVTDGHYLSMAPADAARLLSQIQGCART